MPYARNDASSPRRDIPALIIILGECRALWGSPDRAAFDCMPWILLLGQNLQYNIYILIYDGRARFMVIVLKLLLYKL